MKFTETPLKDSYIIEIDPLRDERGLFTRLYCKDSFRKLGEDFAIEQINYSLTKRKGSVRGMHFQYPSKSEIKVVRCLTGSVFDVIIDIRRNSPTFLNWYGHMLSADKMEMMYIAKGFAHGFQTLENNCSMLYFHSDPYASSYEGALRYNDPRIGIEWPIEVTEISLKDQNLPLITNDFTGVVI